MPSKPKQGRAPGKGSARRAGSKRPRAVPRTHDANETRLALVRAAERLMAERGVDAVSLREVSLAAGQHNNSAVAYHFGSRDGLIDAILARHSLPIHARWAAQLDLLARSGSTGLRPLVEMLVVEIVNKLDDPDGGWEYLSIAGQLSVSPHRPLVEREVTQTEEVTRLISAMMPFYEIAPELLTLRFERLSNTIYASTIGYHRQAALGVPPVTRATFVSDLVDTLVEIITQPPSTQTEALLARERADAVRAG